VQRLTRCFNLWNVELLHLVLGTLGYTLLQRLAAAPTGPSAALSPSGHEAATSTSLRFTSRNLVAEGRFGDEGFVLLPGALVARELGKTFPGALREAREIAISNHALVLSGDTYILKKPLLFGSPSYAAAFVSGVALNGRLKWKDNEGVSLRDLEAAALETLEADT
jgi:hypothetical protein